MTNHFNRAAIILLGSLLANPPAWSEPSDTGTQSEQHTNLFTFDIPPQPLPRALLAFSENTGIKILVKSELAREYDSPGVAGHYQPDIALQKLLGESGLNYRFTSENSVILSAPGRSGIDANALLAMSPMEKFMYAAAEPAEKLDAGPIEQEDLMVRGAPLSSYTTLNASTATKTDTPIMDTPVSIQVIPRTILDDQRVVRLQDALRNVSSVQPGNSLGLFQDDFTVRGFPIGIDVDSAIYRNGVRLTSVKAVTAILDRVEVLKGPAAVLYGRVEPGALINLVTKTPLESPYYSLTQQFGSFAHYRTSLDTSGPVSGDDTVLYRLNLDFLTRNTFRDFQYEDQIDVAPAITWKITDRTRLDLNFEYRTLDIGSDQVGIPAIGRRPALIPLSRNLGDPPFEMETRDDYIVDATLSHAFSDAWSMQFKAAYAKENRAADTVFAVGDVDELGNLPREFLGARLDHDTWYTALNITGHLGLLGTAHTLLIGADYYHETRDSRLVFGTVPDINIFQPSYGGIPLPDFSTSTPFELLNDWYGIYLQDQIVLFDRLHLLLGGRYNSAEAVRGTKGQNPKMADHAWTPRYGVLYRPWEWVSVYGSYVESFGAANAGLTPDGRVFDPEQAKQYEAGIKTEFFDGNLNATLAYFNLSKTNIKVPVPNSFFSLPLGKVRNQGIEFDISGKITESVNLIASYSYINSRIEEGSELEQGKRLLNVPRHSGSLWLRYDPTESFSFGTGVYAASVRELNNSNTAQVPGYMRWDAMAAYHWKIGGSKLSTQLNAYNLLDKGYYENVNQFNNTTAFPGAPRTFIGTLRWEF